MTIPNLLASACELRVHIKTSAEKRKKNDPASLQSCTGQAGQYALVQVDQKRNVFRGYTISSADPSVEPLEVTVKLDKRGGDWRQPDLKDGKRRETRGKDGKRRGVFFLFFRENNCCR